MATKKKKTKTKTTTPRTPQPTTRTIGAPSFAQPEPTADPSSFVVKHASDGAAYKSIDALNAAHKLKALPFPAPRGLPEPRLTLAEVIGNKQELLDRISAQGQIVFHSTGDCGNTRGPTHQNEVTDKMVADFHETHEAEIPQFNFLLGDIVYSFGEANYYYDQFYEPYRNYPAPILAVPGNHDGMISPLAHAKSLDAYLRNFCADDFVATPEAGGLARTAQIQPGVFYTFDAPFVRIIALYSNTLEDPGVIADENTGDSQLEFVRAALGRVKQEQYAGALLFADHHPPFTVSRHGWSVELLAQIDKICEETGVWPHAFLSGHAHNYQRFTRTRSNGTQIPYIVCGNGGHNVQRLTSTAAPTLRAPQIIQKASDDADLVTLENYDDTDYGYLRVVVSDRQLRIEFHPASDGHGSKAPDDAVTVDLRTRKIVHFNANDLGRPEAAKTARREHAKQRAADGIAGPARPPTKGRKSAKRTRKA